jgi:nitroimidazol reductase NimA-like FMN-containing flavoprotein (pyridoxamine 5'-phosphate oxidase superfamily)
MLDTMQSLLKSHDFCVLATESRGRPHCSLMAYVVGEDGRRVYMVTERDSVKFRNLQINPVVSFLVDTRETHGGKRRPETKALTVAGRYEPLEKDAAREEIKQRLLEKHPQLEVFLKNPDAEIIPIHIQSFLLLDGLTDASYEELQD